MYAFIRGRVAMIEPNVAVLDCSGVGYKLFCTRRLFNEANVGDEITLYTQMIVREDEISLYGFATEDERKVFEMLISVSGVGPKAGLAILSDMDASETATAIISGDVSQFTKISGIGKKTAERIVIDLKDKIDKGMAVTQTAGSGRKQRDAIDEAVDALVSLGYQKMQAINAVKSVSTLGDTAEELILLALKRLDVR
ncbi:MAG: Holliday junction branch migration protein RuvA [Clostridia bacterium]|nr:Holliday junction branch migration protein RuvA [Clostridia bacterium]MBQ5956947.1 Holliday junction branch migration protein RuvA [Clostridia bacterium]